MSLIAYRSKIYDFLVCTALLTAIAALVIFPAESISAAKDGLTLCANVIIPSLFPFFVLSSLVVETGITRYLGVLLEPVMRPLFNVGGECAAAFALGFIGGYPVGAKTVIALYEAGSCSKPEAERLLSFCNNSGPAFIFGVVGAGVFSSSFIGLILYLAHTLASIFVGILFRNWRSSDKSRAAAFRSRIPPPKKSFPAAFSSSVKSSFLSTLSICGFVIFFTVFIKLLFISGLIPALARFIASFLSPFGFNDLWAQRLLTGIIELSSGVWSLKDAAGHLTGSVAMAAFILGWAGISVHSQVLSFIGDSGLSVRTYIAGKLLQGIFSAALVFLVSRFFFADIPASSLLAEQVSSFASLSFFKAALVSFLSAALVFFIFLFGAAKGTD